MPPRRDARGVLWILHVDDKQFQRTKNAVLHRMKASAGSKKGCSLTRLEDLIRDEGRALRISWKSEATYNSVWSWLALALPAGFSEYATLEVPPRAFDHV